MDFYFFSSKNFWKSLWANVSLWYHLWQPSTACVARSGVRPPVRVGTATWWLHLMPLVLRLWETVMNLFPISILFPTHDFTGFCHIPHPPPSNLLQPEVIVCLVVSHTEAISYLYSSLFFSPIVIKLNIKLLSWTESTTEGLITSFSTAGAFPSSACS